MQKNSDSQNDLSIFEQARKCSENQEFEKAIYLCKSASAGEGWLANYYLFFPNEFKNAREAFRLATLGVKKNSPMAWSSLGHCYRLGFGVKKNIQKAIVCYKQGALLNNPNTLWWLALAYLEIMKMQHSKGITLSYGPYFIRLLKSARAQGSENAHKALIVNYFYGMVVKKNIYEAVRLCKLIKSIPKSMPNYNAFHQAQELNISFLNKHNDFKDVFLFYFLLAKEGNSDAQIEISEAYARGHGTRPNLSLALYWGLRAQKQKNPRSYLLLGNIYNYSEAKQDLKKAINYYQLALNSGNILASYELAKCYEKGKGVKQNLKQALEFYRYAEKRGYKPALHNILNVLTSMSNNFNEGNGVNKDVNEGRFLLHQFYSHEGSELYASKIEFENSAEDIEMSD